MPDQPDTPQIILALDVPTDDAARQILDRLDHQLQWVKIGLQLYLRYGNPLVEEIASRGYRVFLDLKLHDIPNTVASAIKSLASVPCAMLTVHASGGREMLEWAAKAAQDTNPDLKLLAVTVLTSMNHDQLTSVGVHRPPEEQVIHLAKEARAAGITGLVCSAREITPLRAELGGEVTLVTPGIRPIGSDSDEQKRIMTPRQAMEAGSNYLVIGRPILAAPDPAKAIQAIQAEMQ